MPDFKNPAYLFISCQKYHLTAYRRPSLPFQSCTKSLLLSLCRVKIGLYLLSGSCGFLIFLCYLQDLEGRKYTGIAGQWILRHHQNICLNNHRSITFFLS